MPRRLVITNGDWTTRHEIGEADIVIGRDPNCDLFFVNQKLSRRHARIEPGADGVRLVDLGSRNGVWVNEKKMDQHWLVAGDSIRLGGLRIVFEEDEEVEPTVDTVVLPRPPDELGDDERTVVLHDANRTPGVDESATVILEEEAASERVPEPIDASTRIVASSDATERVANEEPILVPEPEPLAARAIENWSGRWRMLSWHSKLTGALLGLTVLLGALLVGLIRTGSWLAGILFGLLFATLLARVATVLARKLLVEPVARLARDAAALEETGSLSLGREYAELDELATSINRLQRSTGRATGPSEEQTE